MVVPMGEVEEGWVEALQNALDEVSEWIALEPEPDIQEYFLDAYANLENLLANSSGGSSTL